jgi:hypothetical protein
MVENFRYPAKKQIESNYGYRLCQSKFEGYVPKS